MTLLTLVLRLFFRENELAREVELLSEKLERKKKLMRESVSLGELNSSEVLCKKESQPNLANNSSLPLLPKYNFNHHFTNNSTPKSYSNMHQMPCNRGTKMKKSPTKRLYY